MLVPFYVNVHVNVNAPEGALTLGIDARDYPLIPPKPLFVKKPSTSM